jgi:transcriptional regulator with PAS, ATPase and Fis domain
MRKDMNDMKVLINEILQHGPNDPSWDEKKEQILTKLQPENGTLPHEHSNYRIQPTDYQSGITISPVQHNTIEMEESLSLADREKEFIRKALSKYKGRRKQAAKELGISERTLYRKMNEYNLH